MSETATRPKVGQADPFSVQFEDSGGELVGIVPGSPVGRELDRIMGEICLAQRCPIKRSKARVMAECKAMAAAAGDRFFYRIPVKNKNGSTSYIEGPSIDCAMGAVNEYGNCRVTVASIDGGSYWIFVGIFNDFETGTTIARPMQQRKNQRVMGPDAGRNEDIAYQIGVSKAMRNVILAALPLYTQEMFVAAKSGMLDKIDRNQEAYRSRLLVRLAELEIPLVRVERMVGRPAKGWLVPDMAKLVTQVQAITDGMMDAEEAWPSDPHQAQQHAEGTEGYQREPAGEDLNAKAEREIAEAKARQQQQKKDDEADTLKGDSRALDEITARDNEAIAAEKAKVRAEGKAKKDAKAKAEKDAADKAEAERAAAAEAAQRAQDEPLHEDEEADAAPPDQSDEEDEDGAGLSFS